MKKYLILLLLASAAFACTDFLEPLPDGSYNSSNYQDYPKLISGYIDRAYLLLPSSYLTNEFIGLDGASDDLVFREETQLMHQLSIGTNILANYPFQSLWERDYKGLYYVNLFLKDSLGINQHYKVDPKRDSLLRRCLQGDAFGLRAWYHYDLMRKFAGTGTDGRLLGIVPMLSPTEYGQEGIREYRRETVDESVRLIIKDCDSALRYLPLANRDFVQKEGFPTDVVGAVRYKKLDQVAIHYLKAMTYLLWASPAYNPDGDMTRWASAAQEAYEVIRFKLTRENVTGGFDPAKRFLWTDPNSSEAVWVSNNAASSAYETAFYPAGFGGSATYGPTQELVDAFPMANGYPIGDPRGGFDPAHPLSGRDPRLYSAIFYDGAEVRRNGTGSVMYTFEAHKGGKDEAGRIGTSPTNYYIRKYIHLGWNSYDASVTTGQHCIFRMRWSEIVLAFAEAANRAYGPTDGRLGLSAKDALAYLRSRPTNDDLPGIGAGGTDPYLDECAASADAFEALVRNEWRLETCFEGKRLLNLFRWGETAALSASLHRGVFTPGAAPSQEEAVLRALPAASLPIPPMEIRRTRGIVQNKGWETWR